MNKGKSIATGRPFVVPASLLQHESEADKSQMTRSKSEHVSGNDESAAYSALIKAKTMA